MSCSKKSEFVVNPRNFMVSYDPKLLANLQTNFLKRLYVNWFRSMTKIELLPYHLTRV